jgi:site-specific DNA-cytosine methylase
VKAKRASTPDDDETWKEGEVAPTLNAFDNGGDSRATVVTVQEEAAGGDLPPECEDAFGWQEDRLAGTVYEDEVPGLTTSKTYAVAVDVYNQPTTGNVAQTLNGGGGGNIMPHALTPDLAVRRLTPRECERHQGFPDDYTLIPYLHKPAADGPRYKALGNSLAVPVMRWIGERIARVDAIKETAR